MATEFDQLSIFDPPFRPKPEPVKEPKPKKAKAPAPAPDPEGVIGNWRLSLEWNNFYYSGEFKCVSKRCARYRFITENGLSWKVKNLIQFELN